MRLKVILAAALALLTCVAADASHITVGAARTDQYINDLKGKRIALFSNHTGMVGDKHTLDIMLENGLDVRAIFSPEHGSLTLSIRGY